MKVNTLVHVMMLLYKCIHTVTMDIYAVTDYAVIAGLLMESRVRLTRIVISNCIISRSILVLFIGKNEDTMS